MGGDITQPTTTSMIPQRLSTNLCRSGSTGTTPLFRKESCVAMSPEVGRVVGETYWLLGWIVVRTEKPRATPNVVVGASSVIGIDAFKFSIRLRHCLSVVAKTIWSTLHHSTAFHRSGPAMLLQQHRLPDVHFPCGDDGDGNDDAPNTHHSHTKHTSKTPP